MSRFNDSSQNGTMKQRYGWLGILLCLVLTVLVVYGLPRLGTGWWAGERVLAETSFTLLATAPAANGYASSESQLWLITKPEQIDQVRYFVLPDAVAKLEQVDYRRTAVVVLLTGSNTALTPDAIASQAGVVTVSVHNTTTGSAAPTASVYYLLQIPHSATTQTWRKLVLHRTPAETATPAPSLGPNTPQPSSPFSPLLW